MSLGHLEYLLLGIAYQVGHVDILVVGAALYLGGGAYQLALHVFLCYDLGVELDVGRRGHLLGQLRQIGRTPHALQLAAHLQTLGHGIEVDRFELARQILYGLVYEFVLLGIECVGRDILLHGYHAVAFEHQGAEHGLLQLDGLRRDIAARLRQTVVCFTVA